jgi:hypothetical protein
MGLHDYAVIFLRRWLHKVVAGIYWPLRFGFVTRQGFQVNEMGTIPVVAPTNSRPALPTP